MIPVPFLTQAYGQPTHLLSIKAPPQPNYNPLLTGGLVTALLVIFLHPVSLLPYWAAFLMPMSEWAIAVLPKLFI